MLRDFRDVAADLALSAGPRDVSAGLEDRVLGAIRSVQPIEVPVVSRRRRIAVRFAAIAAVLALAASWTFSATLLARVHSADRAKSDVEQVLRVISDPASKTASLRGSTGTLLASYRNDGTVILLGDGIPGPGTGRVLQLWLVRDGVPVAVSTFVPDSGRVLLQARVAAADYQALAVTIERGAVQKPTGAPIYSGTLRA